jgi:Family of unknown function (DUF5317)
VFILYALILGIVVGLCAGGRVAALGSIQFRWAPLIVTGLIIQLVLFTDAVAARVGEIGPALYVGSTLLVGLAVLRNVTLPGVPLVVLGAAANMSAILANGGFMPATPSALAALGKSAPTIYSNSAVLPDPALAPLIDRFALPTWLPFANIFSVGDVLLGVGIAVLIVTVMRRGRPPGAPGAARQLPLSARGDGTVGP